ncbi:MAG: type IV pilus secretin PilQ [Deltaproteobacteria bacterium]|nr:type IV pilus secretin PilQ [Deltaproteobacteria bacterium]
MTVAVLDLTRMTGRKTALVAALATLLPLDLSAAKNVIQGVDVVGSGDTRIVRIQTSVEPTFTVFRLSDPMRVVVDVSGADLSELDAPIAIEDGLIDQIATRQFSSDGFNIGRLMIGFTKTVAYDVQAEGNAVVVRVGNTPQTQVIAAAPPPVAPVDRAAAERFETARAEADKAAERAAEERRNAETAASRAKEQTAQAEKIAKESERLRSEAERAKAEADDLRRQANDAISRDRAQSEAAAKEAEAKVVELQKAATAVARSRAAAERIAAEAERKRLDAEETAARAEAKHKEQVAELEERVAKAQQEKQAAEKARERAQVAKAEAERAGAAAEQARAAASKAREEIDARLAEISDREREAQAALQQLHGEKRAVAAMRERVSADQDAVEKARRELEAKEREVEGKQAAMSTEKTHLVAMQRNVEAAQAKIENDRKALAAAQAELQKNEAERSERERHAAGVRKATTQELNALQAERTRLEELKRSIDAAQAEIKRERDAVASVQTNLERLQPEAEKIAKESAELKRQRDELERKRRELAAAEAKAKAEEQARKEAQARHDDKVRREEQARRVELARKEDEQRQARRAREEAQARKEAAARARESKSARKAARAASVDPEMSPDLATVDEADGGGPEPTAAEAPPMTPARTGAKGNRVRLLGVEPRGRDDQTGVLLLFDRNPTFDAQRLENPPRLVVDLKDTDRSVSRRTYGVRSPYVRRVRLGDHGQLLRVVFDLSRADTEHVVTATREGLFVSLKPAVVAKAPQATPAAAVVAAVEPPKPVAPQGTPVLKDVRFTGNPDEAHIVVEVPAGAVTKVDDRSPKSWVLEIRPAVVPKSLEASLDTTAYGSVVRLVSTYQASLEPPVVNVVVSLTGPATQTLVDQGGKVSWVIRTQAKPMTVASVAAPQTAGFAADAAVMAASTPTQTRQTKKRISIDLKEAEIVNVLRLLAEVSGANIVTSDDVKGKITLRLRDVPWDQALDTILKSKGYDREWQNNIMRIAPAGKIREENEMKLAKKKAMEQIEDTKIKMITINYASAADIVGQIKPLLSPRGSVQPEPRTNTIILEDVDSNLDRVVELVRRLDKQTPQVLIESRIVEASSSNNDELGIQWGGTGQATAMQGNPTGLMFPGDVTVSGAADPVNGNRTEGTSNPGRFAVNLPAAIGAGAGGGLGFIFGSAGGSQLLNLRLSALESNGKGRIISSPRITTLDNKTAKISQGIDIPITVVSAAGANTRFIPAVLELEVTPHVTNDGSVLLKIKTSKNEPSQSLKGAQGDPAIEKKQAETEVLVRDGDTTVIGGIYTRNTAESYDGVPFFSDIPVLGWLFKKRSTSDKRAELLVFITPRIINREESAVQSTSLPGKVSDK